ncbi:MAG TPA: NAD(P)-dependent glycerol-1-phosphate dehydrogenase, partial [Candidatus Aenigmarchaeota archaeon]|nr:NAD(P)-dependent glycerol-1-phosphate dehydrogenase [Candidatus Aenigmarchaeota archaeon]
MEPHLIELPRKVLIGKGVIKRVSDICKDLNTGRKTFI